jgi:hypothetical protein
MELTYSRAKGPLDEFRFQPGIAGNPKKNDPERRVSAVLRRLASADHEFGFFHGRVTAAPPFRCRCSGQVLPIHLKGPALRLY